jgi:uncharacterized membrane protein YgaE (UPF0421/DUF939 family)
MLGYFRDFVKSYFIKPEYEINEIQNVDLNQVKSEWYFLQNLFNDEKYEKDEKDEKDEKEEN